LKIEPAKPIDAIWIKEKINMEFPYTKLTKEKIEEKITNPKFVVLIAKQENIYTGFSELEIFFDKKEARLNGIYVEDAWRDQGIAKEMIAELIHHCKLNNIEKIFLLVKTTNEDAKELYKKTKFAFEKIHDKEIEDTLVEVWSQKIPLENHHRHNSF